MNSQGGTIDGPTTSGQFIIKSITSSDIADSTITGSDVSPGFMIRKTLKDDEAGHPLGWNPDGVHTAFLIHDPDFEGLGESKWVEATDSNVHGCHTLGPFDSSTSFNVKCEFSAPVDNVRLDYIITKLPANVVTSSQSESESAPTPATSLFTGSIDRQDETSSEFPSSLFASSQDIGSTNIQDEISSEFP